ncbi:hypothetical protein RS84_00222 [Microbacterium hydrocarbonoxydans]|uniref:Uncharacterized protein n=1 Tax=Microbacterium hydrocarbonoxydans TaxID=273678 RepID=A0A0M2HYK5_9MICO|nr:hypothetical protein [Microbacterium hydrocarbonoxydans]KJL49509.1 hypothetical protein RS84_00222 [Microbacterium hydrocarbonoxydans]
MTDDTIHADPMTGTVVHTAPGFDIVPLDIAMLDEELLAQWAPTPVQIAGALAMARAKNLSAPAALDDYRRKLQRAERSKKVALGMALKKLRDEYGPRYTMTELRELAYGTDQRLIDAMDAHDDAWLAFEYAKDFAEAIERDVSLLQSIAKRVGGENR